MWLNAQPAYRFKAGVMIGLQILSVLLILNAGNPQVPSIGERRGKVQNALNHFKQSSDFDSANRRFDPSRPNRPVRCKEILPLAAGPAAKTDRLRS